MTFGGAGEKAGGSSVAVSVPGKLILMGEHAVVYGRPALVAAIDLRLRARFSSPPDTASPPEIELDLPGLGHRVAATWAEVLDYARAARGAWDAYAAEPGPARFLELRGDDPAHIVKAALGETAAAAGERGDGGGAPRLRLRLDSELPLGSGFGSSAAAAVAVVGGYLAWRAEGMAGVETLDATAVERLALEAERRQHGLPSGVDTATCLRGGLLWAQRSPSGTLAYEPLPVTSPLLGRLRVYHSGTPPEPTGAVVAAVRTRHDGDPAGHERLFDRMEEAARAFRSELLRPAEDPGSVVAAMREVQGCLEALGVVPEPVRALVRRVEAEGGAAKVSGAGSLAGPGAGSLLVYHPDPGLIAGWDFLRSYRCYSVHLGADGFRRETS